MLKWSSAGLLVATVSILCWTPRIKAKVDHLLRAGWQSKPLPQSRDLVYLVRLELKS